ncbi:MAG: HU family DNA-binding protein, partial [Spirochaetaceae bacterium]
MTDDRDDRSQQLNERIRRQIESVAADSGLPPGEDSIRRITENWLAKRRLYHEQTDALRMVVAESLEIDDPNGMLLLTYSGSLIVLGPANNDGGRGLEYVSIALRTDVPHILRAGGARIRARVVVDQPLVLGDAPLEHSSDLLSIATFDQSVSFADQRERLRQAAIFLTNGFVRANRTMTDAPLIDHFTTRGIVGYVAARNGVTQTVAREIIDDYLSTVEAGMMLGERVSVGSLGSARLALRTATKAR